MLTTVSFRKRFKRAQMADMRALCGPAENGPLRDSLVSGAFLRKRTIRSRFKSRGRVPSTSHSKTSPPASDITHVPCHFEDNACRNEVQAIAALLIFIGMVAPIRFRPVRYGQQQSPLQALLLDPLPSSGGSKTLVHRRSCGYAMLRYGYPARAVRGARAGLRPRS